VLLISCSCSDSGDGDTVQPIYFFECFSISATVAPGQREICSDDQQPGGVTGKIAEKLREGVQRGRKGFGQRSAGRRRPKFIPSRSREAEDEHGHQKPTL